MKRQFVTLMLILNAWMLLGCDINAGSNPDGPATALPDVDGTPDLGDPTGVAQAFLNAWVSGDYAGMYSLITPNSQVEYTEQDFTATYEDVAAKIQMESLSVAINSLKKAPDGNSAEVAFRVAYQTSILDEIPADIEMQMNYDDARWGIVWTPALIFPELRGGNTLQLVTEWPSRANIYDRNGQWLVSSNAQAAGLYIVSGRIPPGEEEALLNLLSRVLRMTPERIHEQYASVPADWIMPLGVADAETIQIYWDELSPYMSENGGPLSTDNRGGRRYFNVLAPHVLGYTGRIQASQLEVYRDMGYPADAIIGQSGLEEWGEPYLAGSPGGTLWAIRPDGQRFAEIAHKDPEPAQSLYTTLDRDLQIMVQDAVEEAYRVSEETWAPTAGGAVAIVMDVNNGDVLAMYSYPPFDPNIFHPNNDHPLQSETSIQDLLNNPLRPLLNRATQGQYPPGSIFKIVSLVTALESGAFTTESTYTCTGVWNELGDIVRYDWKEGGHGTLTLLQGLTASCNPWFYHIGLNTYLMDPFLLPTYAREFMLGSELGISIAEESGLVPDPDWMDETLNEQWRPNHSVNIAIGQGDLLVTPLQIATLISTVANGGSVYQPQLVSRIGLISEEPTVVTEPVVLHESAVSAQTLQYVRQAMHSVTTDARIGTAEYRLGTLEVQVAGKTGTAETPSGYPHAWFGGFAPYEDPEIAVVVMVENGNQGSSVAAPIFRRIVESYYDLRVLPYPPDWADPGLFDFIEDDTVGE